MRKLTTLFFAVAATFLATGAVFATPLSPAAVCKAAEKATMVSKAHCRVVRRCGTFGCSYEEVCS